MLFCFCLPQIVCSPLMHQLDKKILTMKNTCFILLFLLVAFNGFAQGWEQFYGQNSALTSAYRAIQLPDGDYIFTGNGGQSQSSTLTRTTESGIQKWQRALPPGVFAINPTLLPSGNLRFVLSNQILEIDTAANVVSSIPISPALNVQSILRITDGYIGLLHTSPDTLQLWKIDLMGNHLWQTVALISGAIPGGSAVATPDGGFLYASAAPPEIRLTKFDADGNIEWTKLGGSPEIEGSNVGINITSDGGYIASTSGVGDMMNRLLKFDGNGDLLWWGDFTRTEQFEGLSNATARFIETSDGGFISAGTLLNATSNYPSVLKFTSTGAVEFFHVSPRTGNLYSIIQTNDGGFHAVGRAINESSGSTYRAYALKLDGSGAVFPTHVKGNVATDEDLDCLVSSPDIPLGGWVIKATGSNTYHGVTDANGFYLIGLDTGAYALEVIPPNDLWSPCENPILVNLNTIGDTLLNDFPIQATVDCPAMLVDIGVPFLRRCFNNNLTVQYCNQGTITADGATIEVTLDSHLEFISSDITPTTQAGNTFTFPIGDIGIGECGNFQIVAYLNCEASLGETVCMEAHAYPDTICGVSFSWSGASMMARAQCQGDTTVILELENVGPVPTSEAIDYIVIEDQIIFLQDSKVFEPLQVETFLQPANGSTWRIISEQEPNHPGNLIPTAFVEGCGTNEILTISTGFVNEHPMADGDGFIDIDCEEVIGAFDPNDKMGWPKGYGNQHYIEPNTDIEYRIRFQNTGTDTAFTVVIRDTLSPFLDPATLRAGAASHHYEFDLEGDAVAIFRFENILLPDSNVNEALSHGFINFRISQKPDVALESVIENQAAIYFDFNEPVITNLVFHTVGRNFIEIVNDIRELPEGLGTLLTYPNPSAGEVTFEIPSEQPVKATFVLYDQLGRLVLRKGFEGKRFQFNGYDQPKGIYFYKVEVEGLGLYSGKVILK